jgi:hypothetical protein
LKNKKSKIWNSKFIELAQAKGYIVKKPTSAQFNRFINFVIVGKGKDSKPQPVSLSLKNLKSGKMPKWLWVEIKNREGSPGWLYGDADFIVFELVDEYLFVNRKNLVEFVHSNIDFSMPLVQNTWEAKYKMYQRNGSLDQITQIKLDHLKSFPNNYSWKKQT